MCTVHLQISSLPQSEADSNPVGLGRDPPNRDPVLLEPKVRGWPPCPSQLSHRDVEEGHVFGLDWTKLTKVGQANLHVVPVVVQDVTTKEVLILAYANQMALVHTLNTGICTMWSTSRNELWVKGLTSGDFLDIVEVRVNCEQNSLLYLARPCGSGACHTKDVDGKSRPSCYYRRIVASGEELVLAPVDS